LCARMACAKPSFWEKFHSAAAEHAALALEFKVPANSRPALDWQSVKSTAECKPSSSIGIREDLYQVGSSASQVKGKEVKETKQEKISKSQSATLLPGSSKLAKPTPPPIVIPHRPAAPAPTRFQPQALGILPKQDKRLPDRQQPSCERPKNDLVRNKNSMDAPGRSHSCSALKGLRLDKCMKDTRSLLAALVQPPISEVRTDFDPVALPYHMQRFGQLGDRLQSGTDTDVRQLLSGVASFHKPKKDTYAASNASTQPGSNATSLTGSTKSSPSQSRLVSKQHFP